MRTLEKGNDNFLLSDFFDSDFLAMNAFDNLPRWKLQNSI